MKNNVVRELVEQIQGELLEYGRDNVVPMLEELQDLTGVEGYLDDIIHTDLLDEFVQSRLSSGGWQGVACMLADVKYMNDDYYMIDGYGNIATLETRDLEIILGDMLREIDLTEYDEEEEDEE